MVAGGFFVFRGMIVSLVFAVLAGGFISFGASSAIAADNPAGSAFKDPYTGGSKLPNGGGEPGKAYMAFINAAYKKDQSQICKLIAAPEDQAQCLQQKEAMAGYIAMFTQPKSHKVLEGFMKGEEATLNVAYTFASAPDSTGFVVMKRTKGKWSISSFGGSGSGSVSAEASGQVDLGSSSASASSSVSSSASSSASLDEIPGEFALISISANTKEYTGKCPANISWTASITFKMPLPDKFSYHWELSNGRKTPNRVVTPPRHGHMSVREVWNGGKPGEVLNASVRFVAESGNNSMILDPPSVKVTCK
jgi:hypothetical protein